MAFSWKLGNGVSYKYTIPLSLENRLAAFKECAKLGLAICVRSLLFFNSKVSVIEFLPMWHFLGFFKKSSTRFRIKETKAGNAELCDIRVNLP